MARSRNPENRPLPKRWRFYHGAFRYSVPAGDEKYFDDKKQFTLGETLTEAYGEWSKRLNAKQIAQSEEARAQGLPPTERKKPVTIKEGVRTYLLDVTPLEALSTQANHRRYGPIITKRFGHFPIAGPGMPEPRHFYEYVSNRKNKKTGERAITAAHREMEFLSHCYTKFIQWGCLNEHPFKMGQVRFEDDLAIPTGEQRYLEDWEIAEALKISAFRKKGSVRMCQAYIRLKQELKGLRLTDMLQLQPARHFTPEGIRIKMQKTTRSSGKTHLYRWTQERRDAVDAALAARPVDIGPFLFCTTAGTSYISEKDGGSDSFDSIWKRFMLRVVKETKLERGFSERLIRAKVGSDFETVEEAAHALGHAPGSRVTEKHYRRKPKIIK